MKNSRGFTLIEIMVAMAVFAILVTITSVAMHQIFLTQARIDKQTARINAIQFALAIIKQDTLNLQMIAKPGLIAHNTYCEFTRGGITNPGAYEQRSTLVRTAYLCKNHQLIRKTWLPKTHSISVYVLLDNLYTCNFAYLSQQHQLSNNWTDTNALPIAIQLALSLNDWGNMNLLFEIPGKHDEN